MTIFIDDGFDRLFKKMLRSFIDLDDIFEDKNIDNRQTFGPYYYGYTMTIGPNGKPIVREYGNVKPGLLPTSETREPLVDTLVDEKENLVKLVAEMPGIEKKDIKVVVQDKIVQIDAEHGDKKYHVKVPVKPKVDENTAKANYTNGILELVFKLKEDPKPKGKTVEVE